MAPTKSQILAQQQAKLDAALIDPAIVDKRHVMAQLNEVVGSSPSGSGGGGGTATSPADIAAGIDESADIDSILSAISTIADRSLLLPQRQAVVIQPAAAHTLSSGVLLGVHVVYGLPVVCRLHLKSGGNICSVFSYRPIRFDPEWGHVLIPDRSAALPCWNPASAVIFNPNPNPITLQLIYQNFS